MLPARPQGDLGGNPHGAPDGAGPDLVEDAFFFRVVRASFAQRRKTLLNGLSAAFGDKLGKDQLRQAIADAGLPEGVRGEKLGIPEFAALAQALQALGA